MAAAEAAEWLIVLECADVGQREQFAQWLQDSPENVREFLAMGAVWHSLPGVSSQPSLEELVDLASRQSNVIALGHARREKDSREGLLKVNRRWLGWAAAAAVAVALGTALRLVAPSAEAPPVELATHAGEQLSVSLSDGSVVTLNTRSSLRVIYSQTHRELRMSDGAEALFDVAPDAARPFRVIAGSAMIEAVGTSFNVRNKPAEVLVTVLEGAVDFSSEYSVVSAASTRAGVRVFAGQQAKAAKGEAIHVDQYSSGPVAWRERRLEFDALPILEVIEEFNRYQDPPVVIADKELEDLPISGVFRSDDRASFLQFLFHMGIAEHSRQPDGVIVLSAMEDSKAGP
ncbi:MAG: FecR domain-containing protein [Gammaproteobacteria bacterium]|nr:FecR domain-containing protein [Gammaproteobacteria bacterium]MDE0413342.1 FecR domain-containing protein [Gammaproteobacteria bacterium]